MPRVSLVPLKLRLRVSGKLTDGGTFDEGCGLPVTDKLFPKPEESATVDPVDVSSNFKHRMCVKQCRANTKKDQAKYKNNPCLSTN